ncbi:MAG: hypothetical protein H0V67_02620 [Geodermatophilaceae bacterium]|nr:hypothetical protein [Geodermatophilaceae bacterium]
MREDAGVAFTRIPAPSRPVAAGTAVVAVATAALVWAVTRSAAGDSGGATEVPYVANEFDPVAQYVTLEPAPADAPYCTPEQLTFQETRPPRGGNERGATGYIVAFRNTGDRCALEGGPVITLESPSDTADLLTAAAVSEVAGAEGRFVMDLPSRWQLEAGQQATFYLILSGSNCVHFDENTIRIQISHAGVDYGSAMLPEPTCSEGGTTSATIESTLWAPFFPAPDGADEARVKGLTATLDVPETVSWGADLRYTVILRNPTDSDIALESCLRYRQAAGESATTTSSHGVLNCEEAPAAVPANGEIRFLMRLGVPDEFVPGSELTVYWSSYPDALIAGSEVFTVGG